MVLLTPGHYWLLICFQINLEKAITNLDVANLPEREDRIAAVMAFQMRLRKR